MVNETSIAPIALFVYNRPWHTQQTIEALQKNELAEQSELFIFSDGAKNESDRDMVEAVRAYIKTIKGFKNIVITGKEKNCGLANSIIDGVTKIINKYGKIIVIEDDLVTSPLFLTFVNNALDQYQDEKQVGMIHAHIYNINNLPELFFTYKAGCLGWGTWADRWEKINFNGEYLLSEIMNKNLVKKFDVNYSYQYTKMLKDQIQGKNSSWAIRVYASFLLNNLLTFYPGKSLVQHIGFDRGTHCKDSTSATDMDGIITDQQVISKKIHIEESLDAIKKIEKFYNSQQTPIYKKIIKKLKRIFNL